MSLEQELEGVTAPDLGSPDEIIVDDTAVDAEIVAGSGDDEPGDAEGAQSADGKASRTPENVRRELLRKQDESERRIRAEISQIGELVRAALGAATAAPKGPQTYDDLSIEQLREMRQTVKPEQKEVFEAYFTERLVADRVHNQVTQMSEAEKYKKERERANQFAVNQYPQLADKFSPLHAEVNRRLAGMDKNYIKYNPRIVLHITQDVANELGLAPRKTATSRNVTRPASVDGSGPANSAKSDTVFESDAKFDSLASKLSVGRTKFDDAALKRIKERGKLYKQDPRFSGKE